MHRAPFLCAAAALFLALPASAFDVVPQNLSHVDSKYVTLGVGVGLTGFARSSGVRGGDGFGVRVFAGHHFNRFLEAEIAYQFATFRLRSPDPVDPAATLKTGAAMNQTALRLILSYPATALQPFLSAGIGGYTIFDVNPETALSFPMNFQIPLGAGVRGYLIRNTLSLDMEFNYQIIFGENQSADTLRILNLSEVSFDAWSYMVSCTFHFF